MESSTLTSEEAYDFFFPCFQEILNHMIKYLEAMIDCDNRERFDDLLYHMLKVDYSNTYSTFLASEKNYVGMTKSFRLVEDVADLAKANMLKNPKNLNKIARFCLVFPFFSLLKLECFRNNVIFSACLAYLDTFKLIESTNSTVIWNQVDSKIPYIMFTTEKVNFDKAEKILEEESFYSDSESLFFDATDYLEDEPPVVEPEVVCTKECVEDKADDPTNGDTKETQTLEGQDKPNIMPPPRKEPKKRKTRKQVLAELQSLPRRITRSLAKQMEAESAIENSKDPNSLDCSKPQVPTESVPTSSKTKNPKVAKKPPIKRASSTSSTPKPKGRKCKKKK